MPRLTKNLTTRPPKYNVNYLHVQNNPMYSSSAPPPGFYHDPNEYRRHNIIQSLINPDKKPNKTATIVKDQSKEELSTNPMKLLSQRMKSLPEMNKKIIRKSNMSLAKMAEVKSNLLLEKRKKRLMKSQEKNLNIEQEMAPIIAQLLIDDRVDILKEKLKRIGLTSDHLTKLRVSDYEVSLLAAPFTQLLKEFHQENRPLFGLVHRLGLSMAQLAEICIRRSDVDEQMLQQEPISMQVESSNAMTYTDRINLLERKARELQVFKEKEFRKNLEKIEDEMVASTFAKKKGKKQNENRGMELTGKNAKEITSDMGKILDFDLKSNN